MDIEDWYDISVPPQTIRREREKARALRNSQWWKNLVANGKCHYCGKTFKPAELTLDHVIPLARGGRSVKSNCVPCCKDCNSRKKLKTPAEMIMEKAGLG